MIQPSNNGAFVPTSFAWEISQIHQLDLQSDEFKDLIVRLYQNISLMATVINVKDSAYYSLGEFVNSQQFFPNPALTSATPNQARFRQVTRLVVNFGALPNTGLKSVAHGLTPTANWTFTRIYATASDTVGFNYIPIPSLQATISVDATNVNITTNLTSYTVCYVILEYLKL